MPLPWLKGAISGPIRVYGLTVTAAHFSAVREGGGERERVACCEHMRLSAVDSMAGD